MAGRGPGRLLLNDGTGRFVVDPRVAPEGSVCQVVRMRLLAMSLLVTCLVVPAALSRPPAVAARFAPAGLVGMHPTRDGHVFALSCTATGPPQLALLRAEDLSIVSRLELPERGRCDGIDGDPTGRLVTVDLGETVQLVRRDGAALSLAGELHNCARGDLIDQVVIGPDTLVVARHVTRKPAPWPVVKRMDLGHAVAVSRDGLLATGSVPETEVHICSVRDGACTLDLALSSDRSKWPLSPRALSFAPDGKMLAAQGLPNESPARTPPTELHLYRMADHRRLVRLPRWSLAPGRRPWSPSGQRLLAVDGRSRLGLIDTRSGRPVGRRSPWPADLATFSADGRLVAAVSGSSVRVLLASRLGAVARLRAAGGKPVVDVAFSADGKVLLVLGAALEAVAAPPTAAAPVHRTGGRLTSLGSPQTGPKTPVGSMKHWPPHRPRPAWPMVVPPSPGQHRAAPARLG